MGDENAILARIDFSSDLRHETEIAYRAIVRRCVDLQDRSAGSRVIHLTAHTMCIHWIKFDAGY